MNEAPIVVDEPLSTTLSRPRAHSIRGGVVHCMGEYVRVGSESYAAAEFLSRSEELTGYKYSAHSLIAPSGIIYHLVNDDRVSYHAGRSRWKDLGGDDGYPGLNDWFIGAEWLAKGRWTYGAFKRGLLDGRITFTDKQYLAGGWLYATWLQVHGIPMDWILGHSTVAGDDVRGDGKGKLDPGVGFDWDRFRASVREWLDYFYRLDGGA